MTVDATIAANLGSVRSRIDQAARRVGRDPADILLIAVSKTFDADCVRAARAAGQRDFGENKVQEALQKISETADKEIRWHLIGHLQSNKAKKAATGSIAFTRSIHSNCSTSWTRQRPIRVPPGNTGAGGPCRRDHQVRRALDQARRVLDAALGARAVRVTGLMLIPPWNEDQEQTRPWFARLRALRDSWLAEGVPAPALRHLSMGMSHDFEAAIEEGATLVRVGTAIFGKRTVRA